MTLKEMQVCATEILTYFIQTMPDVPFAEDDIVIEFAPKTKMVERAKALCAKYVPDKIINESQSRQLANSIDANALIGRGKSAVLVRTDYRMNKQDLRRILFHELMHIFCAKLEMDGKHFIDIYGSGTTPENPNTTEQEKAYDGLLSAGYVVWSEFIAHYYAFLKTETRTYAVNDISDYINHLLSDVNAYAIEDGKTSLSMACASLLSCTDAEETVSMLKEPDDEMPESQIAFLECLFLIHNHLQQEKPWKISEEFIATLGSKYIMFKVANSLPHPLPSNFEDGSV